MIDNPNISTDLYNSSKLDDESEYITDLKRGVFVVLAVQQKINNEQGLWEYVDPSGYESVEWTKSIGNDGFSFGSVEAGQLTAKIFYDYKDIFTDGAKIRVCITNQKPDTDEKRETIKSSFVATYYVNASETSFNGMFTTIKAYDALYLQAMNTNLGSTGSWTTLSLSEMLTDINIAMKQIYGLPVVVSLRGGDSVEYGSPVKIQARFYSESSKTYRDCISKLAKSYGANAFTSYNDAVYLTIADTTRAPRFIVYESMYENGAFTLNESTNVNYAKYTSGESTGNSNAYYYPSFQEDGCAIEISNDEVTSAQSFKQWCIDVFGTNTEISNTKGRSFSYNGFSLTTSAGMPLVEPLDNIIVYYKEYGGEQKQITVTPFEVTHTYNGAWSCSMSAEAMSTSVENSSSSAISSDTNVNDTVNFGGLSGGGNLIKNGLNLLDSAQVVVFNDNLYKDTTVDGVPVTTSLVERINYLLSGATYFKVGSTDIYFDPAKTDGAITSGLTFSAFNVAQIEVGKPYIFVMDNGTSTNVKNCKLSTVTDAGEASEDSVTYVDHSQLLSDVGEKEPICLWATDDVDANGSNDVGSLWKTTKTSWAVGSRALIAVRVKVSPWLNSGAKTFTFSHYACEGLHGVPLVTKDNDKVPASKHPKGEWLLFVGSTTRDSVPSSSSYQLVETVTTDMTLNVPMTLYTKRANHLWYRSAGTFRVPEAAASPVGAIVNDTNKQTYINIILAANFSTEEIDLAHDVLATAAWKLEAGNTCSDIMSRLDDTGLPVASALTLGGVKVGDKLSIDGDGVLSVTGENTDENVKTKLIDSVVATTGYPVLSLSSVESTGNLYKDGMFWYNSNTDTLRVENLCVANTLSFGTTKTGTLKSNYDSGQKSIASGIRSSDTIYYRRVGKVVFVDFTNIRVEAVEDYVTVCTLPQGYRPAHDVRAVMMSGGYLYGLIQITTAGALGMFSNTTSNYFNGSVSFVTNNAEP